MTRPLALPPGTPSAIVAAQRAAFDKTVRDPQYLADLEKAQIEGDPMSGPETAAAVKAAADVPRSVIERSKSVLLPPKE